jgi:hypothetical protein
MGMPSSSQEPHLKASAKDKNNYGEHQSSLTSEQIRAGISAPVTHVERQAFLKTSRLGNLLGIADSLPETDAQS